jgi:hypothetical protein
MNSEWFLFGFRKNILELDYYAWKDFRISLLTVGGVSIQVDFGDGVVNTVPSNTTFTYSKASATAGTVKIFNANLLTSFNNNAGGIYAVNWNFSLARLLVAKNLINIDIRSGNIYGDIVNLSRNLQQFQLIGTSYGVLTGLAQSFPTTLTTFNCTSTNSDFNLTTTDIGTYCPSLTSFSISGKSKVVGSINALPIGLRVIQLINSDGIRRHEVSYTAGRTWNTDLVRVQVRARDTFGLNTAMLDAILSDLADTTWNNNTFSVLELTQGHGQRTTSSNSDVATIQSYNVTVSLNPAI